MPKNDKADAIAASIFIVAVLTFFAIVGPPQESNLDPNRAPEVTPTSITIVDDVTRTEYSDGSVSELIP